MKRNLLVSVTVCVVFALLIGAVHPTSCFADRARADLNGDGVVNLIDLGIAARAFGSRPGDLNWNPVADLDGNGLVNMVDISIVAQSVTLSGANLLLNPSVETGGSLPDYWVTGRDPDVIGQNVWDSTAVHSGSKSLMVMMQASASVPSWEAISWSQSFSVGGSSPFQIGDSYSYRTWYQTVNCSVLLYVAFWDASGHWMSDALVTLAVSSGQWAQSPWISFTVPSNAAKVAAGMAVRESTVDQSAITALARADDFLLCVGAAITPPAPSNNKILNGDFSQGFTGWSNVHGWTNPPNSQGWAFIDNSVYHDAAPSMKLEPDPYGVAAAYGQPGDEGSAWTTGFSIDGGTILRVGVWVKTDTNPRFAYNPTKPYGARMGVDFREYNGGPILGGATIMSCTVPVITGCAVVSWGTSGWTLMEFTIRAPSNAYHAVAWLQTYPQQYGVTLACWYDDAYAVIVG